MKKQLVQAGLLTLVWFIAILILNYTLDLPHLVSFWSLLALSIIFLGSGLVLGEKRGS